MLLSDFFDCVVMLTMSDWKTEPVSNRYHYATRFAQFVPTFFVQFDLDQKEAIVEHTEFENLYVVHVSRTLSEGDIDLGFSLEGFSDLELVINSIGGNRRLVWCFNPYVSELLSTLKNDFTVFHATELYALRDAKLEFESSMDRYVRLNEHVSKVLEKSDAVAAVSDGVVETIRAFFDFGNEIWRLPNGCDDKFWIDKNVYLPSKPGLPSHPVDKQIKPDTKANNSIGEKHNKSAEQPIAFYQGGINHRLDFKLLYEVATSLKNWKFVFCGAKHLAKAGVYADKFFDLPNVDYKGPLSIARVKELSASATVGLIPFVSSQLILKSLPLKAYEYVAAGLPVVSVSIEELEKHPELFELANNAESFCSAMKKVAKTRYNRKKIATRLRAARNNSWDRNFAKATGNIIRSVQDRGQGEAINVLVLYSDQSTHVRTIKHNLEAIKQYSRHKIMFAPGTTWAQSEPYNYMPDLGDDSTIRDEYSDHIAAWDLSIYDAVIVNYCVRLTFDFHFSDFIVRKLENFDGPKVLLIQDEYEKTETARKWMDLMNFDIVYTCVPEPHINTIYPPERFRNTRFKNVLTGYVTDDLKNRSWIPLNERKIDIGYRGRHLSHRYGKLGYEKRFIGEKVKEYAIEAGLKVDIEWSDNARIYVNWLEFLGGARATLATESGSNMFDFDGHLDAKAKSWADVGFEDAYNEYFERYDNHISMNQISPKVFESISVGTLLVCFEGEYSGVIEPDIHFVPLKKDFSNIEQVFEKIMDDDFVHEMTKRAYRDIIESDDFSVEKFIHRIDGDLSQLVPRGRKFNIINSPIAVERGSEITPLLRSDVASLMINDVPMALPAGRKRFMELFSNVKISSPGAVSHPAPKQLRFVERKVYSKYDEMGYPIAEKLREAKLYGDLLRLKVNGHDVRPGAPIDESKPISNANSKANASLRSEASGNDQNVQQMLALGRTQKLLSILNGMDEIDSGEHEIKHFAEEVITQLAAKPHVDDPAMSQLLKKLLETTARAPNIYQYEPLCKLEFLARRARIHDELETWFPIVFPHILVKGSSRYDYRLYMAVYYHFYLYYRDDGYTSLHEKLAQGKPDDALNQMHKYCLSHEDGAAEFDKKQGADNKYMRNLMRDLNRSSMPGMIDGKLRRIIKRILGI